MNTKRGKRGDEPLCELVARSVDRYFEDLNGEDPAELTWASWAVSRPDTWNWLDLLSKT